jgi:hypothetical protein
VPKKVAKMVAKKPIITLFLIERQHSVGERKIRFRIEGQGDQDDNRRDQKK